jgi:predicted Zn-dependent protease
MTQATGNDDPRVIEVINQAIALDADHKTESAIHLLTSLRADFPSAASILGYLAWFSLKVERFDEALQHSAEAVRLAPASERASLIYFHILWRSKRRTAALEEMLRFLSLRESDEYTNMIKEWSPI